MSLIVANKIYFYSSTNLYYWNYESSFDPDFYSEELIWEKASLVSLSDEIHWGILLDFKSTSSGEQSEGTIYYTGTFNGHTFTKQSQMPYLLDYGNNISNSLICELPDERKLDLIWMNTVSKRYLRKNRIMISSFAIPRQLSIDFDGQNLVLNQSPVMELEQFHCKETEIIRSVISDNFISIPIYYITTPVEIILSFNTIEINRWNFPSQFGIRFWNKKDEYMTFGYDTSFRFYFIDKSGLISSSLDHTNSLLKIPFNHSDSTIDFHIVLTNNTAEFYAEKGKLVLTENYWTENPFNKISFYVVDGKIELKAGRINELLFK